MSLDLVTAFRVGSGLAWLGLVAFVAIARNRFYATFVGIILGIHTLVTVGVTRGYGPLLPFVCYLQVVVYAHFALLVRSRLRNNLYRALVSVPASAFAAGTMLSFPIAIAAAFGADPKWIFIPYGIALLGVVQSLLSRRSVVQLSVDGADRGALARAPHGEVRVERPLRFVQISDPHLGPFMSEARLTRIVERAVEAKPDVVFLTGDLLTMESHNAEAALTRALAPLDSMRGRVFACRGNHDFEAPATIAAAFARNGIDYLIDSETTLETEAGKIQIVGLDFLRLNRRPMMQEVLAKYPRRPDHLRIVLLHDPGAFRHIPDADADLVLSGHTHGGQLGLVSLGLKATIVSLLTKIPDHGFWAQGKNRLYVHRGTGHYGFPLRIGVPGEEGVVEVHHRPAGQSAAE